jgi:hypothetical protein
MIPPLAAWESFYVIVGSAGAALTGLQFVVMALVADARRATSTDTIDAFGTPTIVHFCAVLLVASVLNAPWHSLTKPAVILALCGAAGVGYIGIITARVIRQPDYTPVLEDWIWHNALPFLAYAMLLGGGIGLVRYVNESLFAVATTSLLLLFIGIHNAWDTVTYVAVGGLQSGKSTEQAPVSGDLTH